MTSDRAAGEHAGPLPLADRLAMLAQHAGLSEVYLFRITEESTGYTSQLLLHYPEGVTTAHPGRRMRRALRLVAEMGNPFITVSHAPRHDKQGASAGGQAMALMIAPICSFDSSIWGAVVGIGPDDEATSVTFRSIIQTAEQIGGQVSSWGRMRPSAGPAPVTAPLHLSLTAPSALMHELRTPLAAADFALDIIERAEAGSDDERVLRAIRTLRLGLNEAAHVVQWWSESQQHSAPQPNIQSVSIEAALRQSTALATHFDARIHITIAEDTPLVLADELMLRRVFLNLIENAFRHGKPNGVLEIATTTTHDAVAVRFLNEGVITDSAFEGIVHATQMKESHPENRSHGYGLGIVKTLVQDMGGHVTVESDRRHWTAFIVTLLAARPESAPRA